MSPGRDPQSLGRLWESRAAEYLEGRGLEILARGYRCRLGELDILGRDADGLVVVEVRARRSTTHGSARETVAWRKRQRIVRATQHFLMRHPHWHSQPIRFDVVAIDEIESASPKIAWIKNAFDAA